MIKKIILFFCITVSTATATPLTVDQKVDMLGLFSKISKARIEQQKPFFKKWGRMVESVLSVDSQNYSNTVFKSRSRWLRLLEVHNTKINTVLELSKTNEYSNKWVKRVKGKISEKELKSRRLEISKTLFYLKLKSEQPYLEESAKEIVYYGRIYFNLVDDYINLFFGYYKNLPEKEKKENVYFYKQFHEAKKAFKTERQYHLAIINTKYRLLGEMVDNLKNKDVYNLLNSEKVFQKPFDFFKALNDLYK
ncbi:MAG: hypothetical protein GY760_23985 [Deltaproteobacteria bacterium]|nr:hypothetical protein [Deltaproteobacteria bacterium]